MDSKITVKKENTGDIVILTLSGRIDAETYMIVRDEIEKLFLENKYKIIIDLKDIEYISSAGWGSFIGYVNTARNKKGDIKLTNMKKEVKNVYELIEFNELIESYDTLENAKKTFEK